MAFWMCTAKNCGSCKINKKMRRWKFVLIPFHSRVKVINSFMIPYLSFVAPLLKLTKCHWKEFLSPIKKIPLEKQYEGLASVAMG